MVVTIRSSQWIESKLWVLFVTPRIVLGRRRPPSRVELRRRGSVEAQRLEQVAHSGQVAHHGEQEGKHVAVIMAKQSFSKSSLHNIATTKQMDFSGKLSTRHAADNRYTRSCSDMCSSPEEVKHPEYFHHQPHARLAPEHQQHS